MVISAALRKCSFRAKSYYGPVVFPRGSEEPWEFCEAPQGLLRGREKQRRKKMGGEGERKGLERGQFCPQSEQRACVCVCAVDLV